mgnify:CR=1 FL=1
MKTIWKYKLENAARVGAVVHQIDMPKGAKIIKAGSTQGEAVVWAIVDPDAPLKPQWFYTAWTGSNVPDPDWGNGYEYLDTVTVHTFSNLHTAFGFTMQPTEIVVHVFHQKENENVKAETKVSDDAQGAA